VVSIGASLVLSAAVVVAAGPALPSQRIEAHAAGAGGVFGRSLAVRGDWLAVGDPSAHQQAGAVWLFQRQSDVVTGWALRKRVDAPELEVGNAFGNGVAMDGDWLAVGAPSARAGEMESGAAYIYHRDIGGDGMWGRAAVVRPADAEAGDLFGHAVALDRGRLIVAALGKRAFAGVTYVFEFQNGTGVWRQTARLDPGLETGARFGSAVDVDADYVVIGARGYEQFTGAAWLYRHGVDGWEFVRVLAAKDAGVNDQSGSVVAVHGTWVAMGSRLNDTAGMDAGAVYLFEASRAGAGGGGWGHAATLLPPVAERGGHFGWGLDLEGGELVIASAPDHSSGGASWYRLDPGGRPEFVLMRRLTAGEGSRASGAVTLQGAELFLAMREVGQGAAGSVGVYEPPLSTRYAEEILADRPLVYYRFDSARDFPLVLDRSGNRRHGTAKNPRLDSYGPASVCGNSLRFDGSDQAMILPGLPASQALTFEAWIHAGLGSGVDAGFDLIEGAEELGTAPSVWMSATGKTYLRVPGQVSDNVILSGLDGLGTGRWAHFVMIHDSVAGKLRMFRDGKLVSERGLPMGESWRLSAAWLGRRRHAPRATVGRIDEVAIYDRALSDARVAAHYTAAAGEVRFDEVVASGSGVWLGWDGGVAPLVLEVWKDLSDPAPAAESAVFFPGALVMPQQSQGFFRLRQRYP
jgi:hypothetical protein